MTDTVYSDQSTPAVNAAWLNDVNNFVYRLFGNSTTAAAARAALGLGPFATIATPLDVPDGGTGLVSPGAAGNLLVSTGSAWTSQAPAVAQLLPPGSMIDFGGTVAPAGWLECNGASVLISDQPSLFAAIGTAWGSVDGSHFNLPDFRRRVSVGAGGSASSVLGNTVGSTGGEETHTLTTPEIPSHTHGPLAGGGFFNSGSSLNMGTGSPTPFLIQNSTTGATGGGGSHNNMQPSAVVMKIIKT